MKRRLLTCAAASVIVAVSASASAQASGAGRIETSMGVGILGGTRLGEAPANLRAGGSAEPFQLFGSDSTIGRAGVVEVRLGFALGRRIAIEGRGALDRPEWRTTISGDFEGAPDITLVERITEYTVDGGVRVSLEPWRVVGLTPFAAMGAGHLRQLHEQATLVEDRSVFYAGGGFLCTLVTRPRRFVQSVGFRADLRLNVRGGGGSLGDGSRRQGAASAGVFLTF